MLTSLHGQLLQTRSTTAKLSTNDEQRLNSKPAAPQPSQDVCRYSSNSQRACGQHRRVAASRGSQEFSVHISDLEQQVYPLLSLQNGRSANESTKLP